MDITIDQVLEDELGVAAKQVVHDRSFWSLVMGVL